MIVASPPRLGHCQSCGRPVLFAVTRRGELALEHDELLPRMRCPRCKGKRCVRCDGTGWIGSSLPRQGCAVLREDGRARLDHQHHRRPGDALHTVHRCPTS